MSLVSWIGRGLKRMWAWFLLVAAAHRPRDSVAVWDESRFEKGVWG